MVHAMNRSALIGLTGLLLAGACLWWWGTQGGTASPAASAAATAEDELPETAVEPPTPPVPADSVPVQAERAPALAAPPPAAPSAEAAPAAQPAVKPAAAPDPFQPAPLSRLKQAFESDPVDGQARAVEREIRGLFGTQNVPLDTLLGVQCRQRVCKLELRWSPASPHTFMAAGAAISASVNKVSAFEPNSPPDANGERRVAVYIARKGLTAADFTAPNP
jgi:hypothetical protein